MSTLPKLLTVAEIDELLRPQEPDGHLECPSQDEFLSLRRMARAMAVVEASGWGVEFSEDKSECRAVGPFGVGPYRTTQVEAIESAEKVEARDADD